MDYQLENLGPEKFQEFAQALLAREFPKIQCFPVAQRDGGRDAIGYYQERSHDEFIVFQVKYVRRPQALEDPHAWLLGILKDEVDNAKTLIRRGAKEYYLVTNVPGTAYPVSGSIDRAQVVIQKATGIPSQCWWRDDVNRRLDGAWDLKWAYPEVMSGQDVLRYFVESGLTEDKDRRTNAIRAFVRDQYNWEANVRFKQIELQNRLLDLFIDVPVTPRELQCERRKRGSFTHHVITRLAHEAHREEEVYTEQVLTESGERRYVRRRSGREEAVLGAATMLLHEDVQKHVQRIVLEGAPGQGKSTITQYVCQVHRMRILQELHSLSEVPDHHKNGPLRLPVRVDLRDLATWFNRLDPFQASDASVVPEQWHKSLEAFLAALIRHHAGGTPFGVNDLHAVAKTSALLVVLDGLDEVADIQRRKEVVDEVVKGVDRLAELCASLQVVVTSRPAAFANSPGMPESNFQYCELGALTRSLINEYAARWLKARKLQGREAAEVNRILKEKLDQPHLKDLARNPMQLAILLSLIHQRGASLPDKRTALYDSYVELFFSRESEKSSVVREHRDLLIDIHRYLAWVLHSESEQGRSRGSVTSDELHRRVTAYLSQEGYDSGLVDILFKGMIERVVALVSRVEGTYEFEVQPLREYFAARFLYETANYSPPGSEQGGTLPDRLDAIAKNFFWLNVTRFYAGCFSKGELPSLLDRLEELIRAPGYRMISHPRVLAATLLSDWVFAQHPKSMRKVVTLIMDSLGLRRFVAVGSQRRSSGFTLTLPKQCGNEELVEQCFSLLRGMPSKDFSSALIDLLEANTTVAERAALWRAEVRQAVGEERAKWLEYGLHMHVLHELDDTEFDELFADDPLALSRLRVVCRLPQLARWEADEQRFSAIAIAIMDSNIPAMGQSRVPKQLLLLLAHAQNIWRFGVALRNRHPVPLSALWNEHPHFNFPTLDVDGAPAIPDHVAARNCAELIKTVKECSDVNVQEWSSTLGPWDRMVEHSRQLYGDRWAQCKMACVASGIKSPTEQCNEFTDLFDHSVSMCRRARYARLRAGQPAWWEKQLPNAKTDIDVSFALLILITWGSPNCILGLLPSISTMLDTLPSPAWTRLWSAMRETIDLGRSEGSESTFKITFDHVAAPISERAFAAIGERADSDGAAQLYLRHLAKYSGSDYPVLHFAQRQAVRLLFTTTEDRLGHLSMIERSYSRGIADVNAIYRGQQPDHTSYALPYDIAEQIASQPERFPMELVGIAENFCKERVSTQIAAVGQIALRDKWFID